MANVGSQEYVAGAQTCGVHCRWLTPGTGAPDIEGSDVDRVAVSRLQLDQGLTGWDAYNRPVCRSRAMVSLGPGTHCAPSNPQQHSQEYRLPEQAPTVQLACQVPQPGSPRI